MANNYDVTQLTTQPFAAGVNGLFDNPVPFPPPNGYKLTIEAHPGYTIEAKDFGVNGSSSVPSSTANSHTAAPSRWEHQANLPNGIHKVVFEDTDNPTNSPTWVPTSTNKIDVWVYFGDTQSTPYFPGNTIGILIDIDGITRPTGPASNEVYIRDLSLHESVCSISQWPVNTNANPNLTSCSYKGAPNQSDGYHFVMEKPIPSTTVQNVTIDNWPNYTYFAQDTGSIYSSSIYNSINIAESRTVKTTDSQISSAGYTDIYYKFIFCGPGVSYTPGGAPYAVFNPITMPDINIVETSDNYQTTATLTGPDGILQSNYFHYTWFVNDASNIIPGMIISGHPDINHNSGVYPFSFDVRVVDVDYINNKIKLSNAQEATELTNVTLNFSADTADGSCVAKRFIIQSSPDLATQAGVETSEALTNIGDRDIEFYFETMNIAPTWGTQTNLNITGFDI
tara:strand:- start:320 stop:1675 length:1356 start_codon:yes stop_codon:yes gene_type:complete